LARTAQRDAPLRSAGDFGFAASACRTERRRDGSRPVWISIAGQAEEVSPGPCHGRSLVADRRRVWARAQRQWACQAEFCAGEEELRAKVGEHLFHSRACPWRRRRKARADQTWSPAPAAPTGLRGCHEQYVGGMADRLHCARDGDCMAVGVVNLCIRERRLRSEAGLDQFIASGTMATLGCS